MKEDTKKLIVLGGLGAAGIYFLTRPSDAAGAGFGGGGGIPLLPGDTEGAAEGDTIINYILPKPAEEIDWGIDGHDPVPKPKKLTYAPSLISTYPLEYYTAGGVSELSAAATPVQKTKSIMELQHYADPFAYLFSGRRDAPADIGGIVDSKKDAVISQTPKEPVQWGEASVGGFFDFLSPITQIGKGARGRDIMKKTVDAPKKASVVKATSARVITSRTSYKKASTGSGREWSSPSGSVGGASPYRSTTASSLSTQMSTGQSGSGY